MAQMRTTETQRHREFFEPSPACNDVNQDRAHGAHFFVRFLSFGYVLAVVDKMRRVSLSIFFVPLCLCGDHFKRSVL